MGEHTVEDITTALREHGPATGPELATLLGVHPATAERWCVSLQRDGRVRLVTGGRYALADEEAVEPRAAAD